MTKTLLYGTALASLMGFALPAIAQDAGALDKGKADAAHQHPPAYSPYAERDFPTRPFFGDTHLHTAFSMDAGAFGAKLTPRDAYRFARGEEVTSSTGQPVKLSRPLDFLVVADHSDNMGFFPDLFAGKPEMLADPAGKKWYDMIQSGKGADAAIEIIVAFSHGTFPKDIMYFPGTPAYKGAWQETIAAAEDYNNPGLFTAFIGYEWTSNTDGNNLHRNVIFRDNGDKASQVEPFTVYPPYGSDNPVDLWKWMGAYEQKTGGDVLAIAHNGNLSSGLMFPTVEQFGKPVDREYVEQRAKWERLYETSQTKGTGESHPFLSPNDEFASFEIWDKGNLDGSIAKTKDMLEFEYARSALKNGLKLERELGTNPYKFGLISSSDAHNGLAAMEEDNFFGKTTPQEPSPERIGATFVNNAQTGVKIMDWEVGASGYAAVWAKDNTRESLWDAMQRKETYATTGPRMLVRFFGGWEFESKDAQNRLPGQIGYTKGVPMGGDLRAAPEGKKPTFLVAALKDPLGANLDRYQIVKGWLEADGKLNEKVYDVAWSGDRKPDAGTGKLPSVGDTVDAANAGWTNTIGSPELSAVWEDPDFDASQPAFYYGRVIEIPTPRWTAYDAKRFGVKALPGTAMTITERAYTSPIWYTPGT
ncbi:MAG: DUF3604 domain-containing protein [Mesorhizobium sp.]|uniref:DUF3604 domain-containing protein n=1 Tax=Mesorhizobium sp. TaxID=1871066 RepID=UPI000FE9C085|nr:DUF3604 domain-containing protein [Mesorhizobium sp.]RWH78661.1 MAG: DUF3604 domain-containing protein [Mesorhizobium sp.]RWH84096.1 MAG: DUF3604 domain-containing protein [Mesorhizobium sp.]RWH87749.1 MAG: DUF3604 domain-containing protein [Mesorhizobium sp.]RWH94531.1 MAG: DUF3604 domain-containing protein [Mesorhizobium sp.]RWI03527.1 MAG: DUF3604 domain-containing protein [Mesorhizobium sp.]